MAFLNSNNPIFRVARGINSRYDDAINNSAKYLSEKNLSRYSTKSSKVFEDAQKMHGNIMDAHNQKNYTKSKLEELQNAVEDRTNRRIERLQRDSYRNKIGIENASEFLRSSGFKGAAIGGTGVAGAIGATNMTGRDRNERYY